MRKAFHSHPQLCRGVSYFTEPGVVLVSAPSFDIEEVAPFLSGFDSALGFPSYLEDDPETFSRPEALVKFAGQLCYLSLGPKRTMNTETPQYLAHILDSGHGSVLEHAQCSFLFYGVSRSLTHELVRHRAGWAYSQVSQRYVDGSKLRFVERPEFQAKPLLHGLFLDRIESAAKSYELLASQLMELYPSEGTATERRKAVNQAARALLPNETEAPILVSANLRAWRHFCYMRGSLAAEPEIRRVAVYVCHLLKLHFPTVFQDFDRSEALQANGLKTEYLLCKYQKV